MTNERARLALNLWLMAAMCFVSLDVVRAQETTQQEKSARLAAMKARAVALEVKAGSGKEVKTISLRSEPLMRFDDPTRDFYDGTIWAWGEKGRPRALVSIERYEKLWAYECIALSDQVVLEVPNGQIWKPKSPAFTMQPVEGAAVADSATARRTQARELSRSFEMLEYLPPEYAATVLRLIPRPVYEYDDAEAKIASGLLFVYANGTNPEILLVLEAVSVEGKNAWRFGCAPLSTAQLAAKRGGRVVWEAEKMQKPVYDRPYIAVGVPFEPYAPPALEK